MYQYFETLFSLLVIRASSPQLLWLRFVIIIHLKGFNKCLRAGNCCLRHPFSPVLEPRQGGDICSLAGLTWPHVIFSSNNVLLAVQAWGTPSAWRHVPRPPIRWVSSGRWVLSEPCQYIPCPLLPITSSCVFSARHNINIWVTLHFLMLLIDFFKTFIVCPLQGSKFIFRFGSTCATRCKFLGALPKF